MINIKKINIINLESIKQKKQKLFKKVIFKFKNKNKKNKEDTIKKLLK